MVQPVRSLPFAAALSAFAGTATAQAGGFVSGDLYLYNPAYQGLSSSSGAIVRFDPLNGSTSLLVDLVTASQSSGAMAYDPWRDRLIFFGGLVPNHNEVYLSDAAGNLQSLGLGAGSGPQLGAFAPRGDGIIYFRGFNAPNAISYFDAANQVRTLLNASGTAPFAFGVSAGSIARMAYDPGTNALFAATQNNTSTCPGGLIDAVNLRRLELSADGSRVLVETCFQYDLNPTALGEVPVGLSRGPQGDLLMTVDDNSNSTLPRMVRVDPVAATAVPFASNGHAFAAATNAGCFSQVTGRAIVLDTGNDVLRSFAEGEVGNGTVFATGTGAPGGSGETATLVEIVGGAVQFGMIGAPTTLGVVAGGVQNWSIDVGPTHAGLVYFVVGSFSGWSPGLTLDGQAVPLNADAYLLFTLQNPNRALLQNTLGVLDGQGRGTAAWVIPAAGPPALVGLVAHHATVVLGPLATVETVTNAVPLSFAP